MPIIIESKISHQFTQSPKENKNERRIKLENHRFSFVTIQANPSLFEIGENRQSTKLWSRLFIIAQPSFVAGATPRPRSPSVRNWKSGGPRERKILGDKRFVLVRPDRSGSSVARSRGDAGENWKSAQSVTKERVWLKRKRQSSDFIPGHQSSSSSLFHPN